MELVCNGEKTHLTEITITEFENEKIAEWYQPNTEPTDDDLCVLELFNQLGGKEINFNSYTEKGTWLSASALTLEYSDSVAARVAESLSDLAMAFLIVPTVRLGRNTTLFLFPLAEPTTSWRARRRGINLIAEYLKQPTLERACLDPNGTFYPRSDRPVHYRSGPHLKVREMIETAQGLLTDTERYLTDKPID
jgi:hypothetical protein